jgi:hypothetical protein
MAEVSKGLKHFDFNYGWEISDSILDQINLSKGAVRGNSFNDSGVINDVNLAAINELENIILGMDVCAVNGDADLIRL